MRRWRMAAQADARYDLARAASAAYALHARDWRLAPRELREMNVLLDQLDALSRSVTLLASANRRRSREAETGYRLANQFDSSET